MPAPTERLALASMVANLVLAIVKIAAGLAGRSFALVADGIESTADIFSSLVVWRGIRVGARRPDAEHPYGHGKAEALAAFIAASGLLISAGVIAWNAFGEVLGPPEAPAAFTLPVLATIVALKEGLYRWLHHRAEAHDSQALRVEAWHHRSDALTSLGVLFGLALGVIGGERFAAADDVAALLLSGLIAWNGLRLLRPAVDELMDRRVEGDRLARIRRHAAAVDGIRRLETVHLRRSGRHFLVDIHLEVDGAMPVSEGHRLAHELRDRLEDDTELRIAHTSTHVEPAGRPGKEAREASDPASTADPSSPTP